MRYVSTRGIAPALGFRDTILTGLAADGGLYLPESWPRFSATDIAAMAGKSFGEVAIEVTWPFVDGEIARADYEKIIDAAYATFRHQTVCPLVQTGNNEFVLELFHGPTLAFKDVAMQLLGRLFDHVLAERDERATIIGATSGDTGGAAIEAFANRQRADIFILFPEGRVSPVQQRQMTGSDAENVHALAIDGTFDDCQALLKAMFNHAVFRDHVRMSGVNSINWARIMAQIVYYFTSAVALGAPHRPVSFTVPTGNFGDIFAGYAATRMGLPIEKLVIATNDNDILARTFETGRYEKRGVVPTTAPSMDIEVSSNFERLLYEASDRDHIYVCNAMEQLNQSGAFELGGSVHSAIRRRFSAGRCDVGQTAAMIANVLAGSGYLADPHTAIGMHVARDQPDSKPPMVVLGTAHPAKFPEAVERACGLVPALPDWLSELMARKESFTTLPSDLKMVENHISAHSRAVRRNA